MGKNLISKILGYSFVLLLCCNAALTVACQNKPDDIVAVLQKCRQFLDNDELENASACYQNAIVSNPEAARQISEAGQSAVFKKCVEYKEKKDYKKAIICFEGLTELTTDSAHIYFNLADSYYQYDKIENYKDFDFLNKAENAVKRGLELRPKDAAAHSLYGEILKEKGSIELAVIEHEKAVELEPETSVFLVYLGMTQERKNDLTGAIKSYKKVLSLKPNDTLMLYFLGNLYEKKGEPEKAIEAYEKLFKLNPNYDEEAKTKLKLLKEKYNIKKSKTKQ